MPSVPNHLVVLTDARENYPLSFPGYITWELDGKPQLIKVDHPKPVKLLTGDYLLATPGKGNPVPLQIDGTLVAPLERKGCVGELHKNLFSVDRVRFRKAFDRLRACRNPIILLDFGYAEFYKPDRNLPNPQKVLDRLLNLCYSSGVEVHSMQRPRDPSADWRVGDFALRLMIHGALRAGVWS